MAKLLDGKTIGAKIRQEIKDEIVALKVKPLLKVILASDDPASAIYVDKKIKAGKEVGIQSSFTRLGSGVGLDGIIKAVKEGNENPDVHGVLVQLPLPGVDQCRVFDQINPLKDVDVFNPVNVGLLVQGRPRFIPCTPAGIQQLLIRSGISIPGKRTVVINRSNTVGRPLHALLSQDHELSNATVTLCHDQTPFRTLKEICLDSDIIIVAVGRPKFLTADMVCRGQIVVDVGINRIDNKVVGDVDFGPVSEIVEWISKVPYGVGPMTVAMLLKNTLQAAKEAYFRNS